MATPKRKRNPTTRATTTKKPKYADTTDDDDDQLWQAEAILQERRVGRKIQYLIKWKRIDPATGEQYAPTWEPEQNPNAELLASWARAKALTAAVSAKSTGSRRGTPKKAQTPRPRPRKSRVVESSPEAVSTTHPSTAPSRASTLDRDTPTVASSIAANPVASLSPVVRAQVLIRPPGDFDPEEYERFSQLVASHSPTPAPPSTNTSTSTDLDSSQLIAAGHSSGVVQDTQDSAGEGSFVAPTQQTTGTTQPSSTAGEFTEDSGLLDIIGQLEEAPLSPARSIPETIYDTADSQSQSQSQRRKEIEAETEVPDSLETEDEGVVGTQGEQHGDDEPDHQDEQLVTVQESASAEQEESTSHEQASLHDSCENISSGVQAPQHSGENTSSGAEALQESEQEVERNDPVTTDLDPPAAEKTSELAAITADLDPPAAEDTSELAAVEVQESLDIAPSAPHKETDPTEKTQGDDDSGHLSEQDTQSGAVEPTHSHVDRQDSDQASVTEHPEQDETTQFPFHSQRIHHLFQDFAHRPAISPIREETEASVATNFAVTGSEAPEQTQQDEAVAGEPVVISTVQTSPQPDSTVSQTTNSVQVSSTQAEDEDLLSQFLEPEYVRSRSPTVARLTVVEQETVVQSTYATNSVEETVRRRDFALESQLPHSTDKSTASREQNAQIVPPPNDLSTQDTTEVTTEDIRPSIEKEFSDQQSSPNSRHDSSQETPERRFHSADRSSSPIAQPPSHLIGTVESILPPWPVTPVLSSSLSNMASQDTGRSIEQRMKAMLAEKQAMNPYTPSRRVRKSNLSPAAVAATPAPAPSPNLVTSNRRLLRTGADGTRSPSTVPDHSPAPSAPTSLRTVASSYVNQPPTEETREETCEETREGTPQALSAAPQAQVVEEPLAVSVVPAIVTTEPTVPEPLSSEDEHLSDAEVDAEVEADVDAEVEADVDAEVEADVDEDAASLLDDELQLAVEEYIVPLCMEGRQGDMYRGVLQQEAELLERFLQDSSESGIQPLDKIEKVLSDLQKIETHLDLVFAEAGNAPDYAMDSTSQIAFAAEFGIHNSAKFRFMHTFFNAVREQKRHIVLLVSKDDEKLFSVIETFFAANFIHYDMPTKGRQADPARVEDDLSVTVFPSSTAPIIRPADIIICLDGVQDARQIRQKNWAANPDLEVVPILHLVIPRSIGHIERYLSPLLDKRERMHTILASLAHMSGEIGKPIDEDTVGAVHSASLLAEWLTAAQDDRGLWPLMSIGSVKDIIEFQTQGSQTSAASPVADRVKRPHDDDEELDPPKRMRFTPQPGSSMNENEITRISDSMPGTATDNAVAVRAQLVRVEEAFRKERAARRTEDTHYREKEAMWEKQQTEHEDLTRKHRLLLGQHQGTEEKLATATKNNETLRERLVTRTEELRAITAQLSEQRETHLLFDDAKIVEITKLRKDIALATAERDSAVKAKENSDSMLEYIKDQYQHARDEAANSKSVIEEMDKKLAKATHAASGQPAAIKKLHLDNQHKALNMQVRNLKAENATLKKAMAAKDEELARAKMNGERMGVRTRGTSATPQPGKTAPRSRAASPRLSGLRNG